MPAPNPTAWRLKPDPPNTPPANRHPRKPFGWDPANALTFWEVYDYVCLYLLPGFPLSREMVMLLFFHETAFSNVSQVGGPAIGIGQMEHHNPEKAEYFADLGYGRTRLDYKTKKVVPILDPVWKTPLIDFHRLERDFADPDFAIKTHCQWFVWLQKKGKNSAHAMLMAQAGDKNSDLVTVFEQAEPGLKKALASANPDRGELIKALNKCRRVLAKNPDGSLGKTEIPLADYPDYWAYTLPVDNLLQEIQSTVFGGQQGVAAPSGSPE